VDDLLAEDSRVVVYWTLRGRHTGEWFGVPPTGRDLTGTAISRVTFDDGQVTDYLVRPDVFGLLQQF